MREELLAAVRVRTAQALETGDPQSVLAPDAVSEAGALLARVLGLAADPGEPLDLEVLHAVGMLYWQRVQALPPGEWDEDLRMALMVLSPVYESDPDAVPEVLRDYYAEQKPRDKRKLRGKRTSRGTDPGVNPAACTDQGGELFDWYQRTGDLDALGTAVRLYRAALSAVPDRHPNHRMCLSNLYVAASALAQETGDANTLREATDLGLALLEDVDDNAEYVERADQIGLMLRWLFENTGEIDTLRESVRLARVAVDNASDDAPGRVGYLSNLGATLQKLYEHTGDCVALEEAVAVGRNAAAVAPAGDPDREVVLSNLGVSLRELFEHTGEEDLLDEAVDIHCEVLDVTPDEHPNRAGRLTNLGNTLRVLHEVTGDPDALRAAAATSSEALAVVSEDHPLWAANLSNYAIVLIAQFELTGEPDLLYEAVAANRTVLAAHPAHHPSHAKYLSNLSISLELLLRQISRTFDPREVLSLMRDSLAVIADTASESRSHRLAHLGEALRERYQRTRQAPDLDMAVHANELALAAVPSDDPARPEILSNLGITLETRFEHTGSADDLDAAVNAGKQAVAEGADHPARAVLLANLGGVLRKRFEQRGSGADLDEAVRVGEQAVAAGPDKVSPWHNLGLSLRTRFSRTGELADLDSAIRAYRRALTVLADDDPDRWIVLSGVATALRARFERTGELADIDAAVRACHEGSAAAPDGNHEQAEMHATVANVAHTRFTHTHASTDLEVAIAAGVEAATAVADGHPERARYLSNLAAALMSRYRLAGDQADLDAAMAAAEQAVATTGEGHHARAGSLSNLALILQERYEHTGRTEDMDAAANAIQRAVDATPDGHPYQAGMLGNFADLRLTRYERRRNPADLDEALEAGRAGAGMPISTPRNRIVAAWAWARAATTGERWHDAIEAYTTLIDLLDHMSPRSLGRSDQEGALAKLPEFGALATACCVQAGLPDRAVELFEQGRGVLLRYALDSRTDLTDLAGADPGLAKRFVELRDELDQAAAWDGVEPDGGGLGRRLIELATVFDELVKEIRTLPGFANFLAPPSIDTLRTATADGPVVLVNVADQRSDALIVTADGILEPVPLPGLTPTALREQTMAFFNATAGWPDADVEPGPAAENKLMDVLGWLWDEVTGPVLDRLGITGPPPAGPDGQPAWPHVWWCPSGLLSFLPLHASGHHDCGETVMDRVVSSYTPTLRALAHARQPRPPTSTGHLLAVAMRQTPDLDAGHDLPAVDAEIDILRDLFPGDLQLLSDSAALRRDVLAALPTARWAHFACHARADIQAPSNSRLLLSDWASEPLTVVDIARLHLDNAELAFLSACSTARGGLLLSDEAIHLGSAFQLAGFRHVIATLWPVEDTAAAAIARDTYRRLRAESNADQAALALHAATRTLRRRAPARPTRWAAHVHSGI